MGSVSCFHAFRLRKSRRKQPLPIRSSFSSARSNLDGHHDHATSSNSNNNNNMEKKRFDSLESWSMILESENVEAWEACSRDDQDEEEWTADLSQLFIGNKFASGAHSRIYRGIYKQRAVAVKMVRIPTHEEETRSRLQQQFRSEVAFLSRLNKKEPYSLSTETVLRLALDISRGMEYLHSQGVIHRDLKSNNLLLNDEMRVKVADFGTSCLETQLRESKGNMGTYRWMAPEMIKEKPYTRKVDVYSFGIVLWELTTALLPFQGMTPVQAAFAVAEKNERPPLPASCQPVLAHLIKRCWASHKRLQVNGNLLLHRFKGCISLSSSSSIPVHT